MSVDEGYAFYNNSQRMEDYLDDDDDDDDAIKMIKSGEKEITNMEIDENELLDVYDYYSGNLKFTSENVRNEELEEGKMIGVGAIINHEYPEGNIINNNNRLNDKDEDTSLFEEDHYIWGIKNVENVSFDETMNNLDSLIDNLYTWLNPTPTATQNTDMVETETETDKETDNAKDDELDTKENTEMERITMDKETDNAKDDELDTKENTEMERITMDKETDNAKDDELDAKE